MSTEINPYQAPSTDVAAVDVATSTDVEPASKGRRFGTLVVDYLGFVLFSALIGVAVALVFGEHGLQLIERMPELLTGVVVMSIYYLFFEGLWARTPGKWLFGTVVVGADGRRPSFGQVLGRTACRFLPFEAFSFLGTTGWHDKLSNTRVVRHRRHL